MVGGTAGGGEEGGGEEEGGGGRMEGGGIPLVPFRDALLDGSVETCE